jgi:hypothetical protein
MLAAPRPTVDARQRQAPFVFWASEGALAWIVVAMLGAVATLVVVVDRNGDVVQVVLTGLAAADDTVTRAALTLLLLGMLALAASTIGMLLSASVGTIRDDILPGLRGGSFATGGRASRAATIAGSVLALCAATVAAIVDACASGRFGSAGILAAFLAFTSLPLASTPLVVGAAFPGRVAPRLASGWALAVLAAGPIAAAGALAVHFVTTSEAWLWIVAPAAVGSSALVYAVACAAGARRRS